MVTIKNLNMEPVQYTFYNIEVGTFFMTLDGKLQLKTTMESVYDFDFDATIDIFSDFAVQVKDVSINVIERGKTEEKLVMGNSRVTIRKGKSRESRFNRMSTGQFFYFPNYYKKYGLCLMTYSKDNQFFSFVECREIAIGMKNRNEFVRPVDVEITVNNFKGTETVDL